MTKPSARCILAFFTHAQNLAVMNYSGGVDESWVGAQDLSLRVPALECIGELMTRAVEAHSGQEVLAMGPPLKSLTGSMFLGPVSQW